MRGPNQRIIWFFLLAASAWAQPAFEAASIKPGNPSAVAMRAVVTPGRIRAENATLRFLIEEAYQLKPFQLTGGPRWMDSATFEVTATAPASAAGDQLRLMLQSLLAERFQLAIHRETKDLTISDLVVKGTPKLQPAKSDEKFSEGTSSGGRGDLSPHVTFRFATMGRLADVLSRQMGHMVEDQTGLTGEYDFEFDATRDETEANPFIAPYAPPLPQIGLKLETHRGPVEIVVVDRAEKPAGN